MDVKAGTQAASHMTSKSRERLNMRTPRTQSSTLNSPDAYTHSYAVLPSFDWVFLHQLRQLRQCPADSSTDHSDLDNPSLRLSFQMSLGVPS